jgi:hypothetical protein
MYRLVIAVVVVLVVDAFTAEDGAAAVVIVVDLTLKSRFRWAQLVLRLLQQPSTETITSAHSKCAAP